MPRRIASDSISMIVGVSFVALPLPAMFFQLHEIVNKLGYFLVRLEHEPLAPVSTAREKPMKATLVRLPPWHSAQQLQLVGTRGLLVADARVNVLVRETDLHVRSPD